MTTKQLPTKLGKEPLIDVVCAVNFESDGPADTLLPGMLLAKLSDKQPKVETLPVGQLPDAVRNAMPNLQNAPLIRVVLDEKFTVLIGRNLLGVGCLMPYAGWREFRPMIETVFGVLHGASFIKKISRHSLKYADFIKSTGDNESFSRLNVQIDVAGRKLSNQVTHLRTEIVEPPFIHVTTILAPATAMPKDGKASNGTLVDVDTVRNESFSVDEFIGRLPEFLELIHGANKSFFFELLSETGLKELEPQYD